ncbi:hypothetical protein TNCV_4084411 [Trichonephila clavipes]|nr:hypothetical protein TNCV_4084411 [Trichonephila clavipes]
MEPPHIPVFLFKITWMQHVVNDGLAVEVSALASPDRQTAPVWIISSESLKMKSLGVRNTRKQRRELACISEAAGEYETLKKCYRMFDSP